MNRLTLKHIFEMIYTDKKVWCLRVCLEMNKFLIPIPNNDGTMSLVNCIHKECINNKNKTYKKNKSKMWCHLRSKYFVYLHDLPISIDTRCSEFLFFIPDWFSYQMHFNAYLPQTITVMIIIIITWNYLSSCYFYDES